MSFCGFESTISSDINQWSPLSQTVIANVHKISQNVNQMQRMVNQLGTSQDSESLRSQLHQVQHYTNQLVRDTNNSIKELAQLPQSTNASEEKQRRMLRERLSNDFSEAHKSFQAIQRTAAQKEKESVIRIRANSGLSSNVKQFSVENFMSPSSVMSKRSNFYEGKTVFGGSNVSRATRLAGTTPYNLAYRHLLAPVLKVNVKPSKCVDLIDQLSASSKRIFEKLEKASTPLQDAKRVPYYASAQLNDYFNSNYLHRSAKRPKLGPPTGVAPLPSPASVNQFYSTRRFQLIENKDNKSVTSSESSDQMIQSCDNNNKYSLIDSKINNSKESFVGKILTKDSRREERKPQMNYNQNDCLDLLKKAEPLPFPTGASMPSFNFNLSSIVVPKSTKTLTTTVDVSTDDTEDSKPQEFTFSELVPKNRIKKVQKSDKMTANKQNQSFVFSSPSDAINTKPSISLETIEKKSKILTEALKKSVEQTNILVKESSFSDMNRVEEKKDSNKEFKANEKWICVCLYNNISCDKHCMACGKDRESQFKPLSAPLKPNTIDSKPKPESTPKTQTIAPIVETLNSWGDQFKPPVGSWSCSSCFVTNDSNKSKCMACEVPKPGAKPLNASPKDNPKPVRDLWQCFYCNENNETTKTVCNSCDQIKTSMATKKELDDLYREQTFKFGINEVANVKKDITIESVKPTEDKIDFCDKSTKIPLFKSIENTPQMSTSIPISDSTPIFVFGSSSKPLEVPKLSFDTIKTNDTTSATPSPFKFGVSEVSKPIIESKTSEKSTTSTVVPLVGDKTFETTSSLFTTNHNKEFSFGSTSQTPAFSLSNSLTNSISNPNTSSDIKFDLKANNDNTISKSNANNTKPANNQLFSFGTQNNELSNSFISQKPLNPSINTTNSSQFSFGNSTTGQTSSSNIFGNTNPLNQAPKSLSFNQSNNFTFGATTTASEVSKPTFDFKANDSTNASKLFKFGASEPSKLTPDLKTTEIPTTTAIVGDKKFGSNSNLFGTNANKSFNFGNASQTPLFGFNKTSTNCISNANTSSDINFGLKTNNDNTISKSNANNSKPANNQLFSFGTQNNEFSNSFLPQKPLNSSSNTTNSSQFSFGSTTGQTNSSNIFGISQSSNSLTFNQPSTALPAPANTPFNFGGFGATQSTPSVPQIQSQSQPQPLPPPQYNFSLQPSFNFGTMAPIASAPAPGAPYQFSAEGQAINRNIKKAKRRLNPT